METEFNYYVTLLDGSCSNPLLMNDYEHDPEGTDFLSDETIVEDDKICYFQLLTPSKNPNFDTDYLEMEGYAVYSSKIKDVLTKNGPIEGLQLLKAVITENDEEYDGFWLANIYQTYSCLDEKLSTYSSIKGGMWMGIEKIVLDKQKLSEIPFKNRLVFEASEDCAFTLYHESVVDIIKSINPKGIIFVPIEEWHPGIAFDKFR